jgi:competence protein ComEC
MSAPFAWLYVCFAAGIYTALHWQVPHVLLAPAVLLAAGSLKSRRFTVGLCAQLLLFFLLGSALASLQNDRYRANRLLKEVALYEKQVFRIRGTILQTPEISKDFFVLKVRVLRMAEQAVDGIARITVSGEMRRPLIAGDTVQTFARFRLPSNFQTPGSFDYKRYLRKEGVHVLGSVKNEALIHVTDHAISPLSLISRVRYSFLQSIDRNFTGRDAGTLRALWLDDRSALERNTEQTLVDAGIFHVVAISGFHIAVLIAICFAALKHLCGYRKALVVISIVLLFYFLVLEGRSSITRSFFTFLIFSIASWRYEKIGWRNILFLSAFLQIALNPLELFDPGYHLTYLSTAAIVFIAVPLSRYFRKLRPIYQGALMFLLTSFSIQFILAPYQAFVFHKIPFAGVPANFIAIPVSSALIGIGVLLPLLQPAAALFRLMIHPLLDLFFSAARLFSGMWLVPVAEPPYWLVAAFYMAACIFVFARKKIYRLVAVVVCLLCLIGIFLPHPETRSPDLRVHFIDVGQGDSILLQYPDGSADLIDGGGFWNPEALDVGASVLLPYLSHLGVMRLNRVFLTHAHADHMEGLTTLLKYVPAGEFYVSRKPLADAGFQRLVRALPLPIRSICKGQEFRQGDVRISVLAPSDARNSLHVRNDDSLVLLVSYAGKNILLPGDAEKATEDSLITIPGLRADFIKAAHHGSKTSSSEDLLRQIRPNMVFVSVGKDNWFGHPNPDVLQRYRHHHAMVYRTDQDGTIRLTINNENCTIDAAAWLR